MKVVINTCFGGFGLSHKACMRYAELAGIKLYAFDLEGPSWKEEKPVPLVTEEDFEDVFCIHYSTAAPGTKNFGKDGYYWSDRDIKRDDPNLVRVVEELGEDANGKCAELSIVEIPDGVNWEIDEYDGNESIDEVHRSWR